MRTLTWFVETPSPGTGQREGYRLDRDYTPVRAWLHFGQESSGEVIVDINVDGVSLFTYPIRGANDTNVESSDFAAVSLSKDSIVTVDIDQASGSQGRNLTIGLDMDDA